MSTLKPGRRVGHRAVQVACLLALLIGLMLAPSTSGADAPGGLTQLTGADGCYAEFSWIGTLPNCTQSGGMAQGHNIVLSPDGRQAYQVAPEACCTFGNTIVIFDRNTTTGVLARKPGVAGCVSDAAFPSCTEVRSMRNPRGVAFSNDGATMYVAAGFSDGIVVFTRNTSDGTLTQKAGTLGCIVENNTVGGEANTCADGHVLVTPQNLVVSSDGKHLYVASQNSDAVAVFGISGTGTLAQTPGTCVQDTGASGCADGRALDSPFSLALSADGSRLYVGTHTDKSITTYVRDSVTGALTPVAGAGACVDDDATEGCTNLGADMGQVWDLALRDSFLYAALGDLDRVYLFDRGTNSIARRAGDGGCVANAPTADCTTGRQLDFPDGMALSEDGRHLYVAGYDSSGLIELIRAADGSLTPAPTARGCYTSGSSALCTTGNHIANNRRIAVSSDGRFVYATGDHTLNAFRRDANAPVCQDGSATIGSGQSIVLVIPCSDDPGDPMEISIVTPPNGGSVGSVDQATRQVTFTAFSSFSGTTSFTFRGTSNGVSSATKTFTINVTGSGPPPPPLPPPPPPPVVQPPPKPRCVVPRNLKGKTLKVAKASLKKARCSTGKVTKAFSSKVKKNRVIRHKPAAGRKLANGAKVNLVLSKGPKRR